MAKDLGLSCPLCLDVNDPEDMLPVKIGHKHPPSIVEIHLCADCFQAVIRAVKEQLDTQGEVSSDEAPSDVLPDGGNDGRNDGGDPILLVDAASEAAAQVDAAHDSVALEATEQKNETGRDS